MSTDADVFYFVCCQCGAESVLKDELSRQMPLWRFAYSRPGFVTFKTVRPQGRLQPQLKSVFARSYGISIGRVVGSQNECERACDLLGGEAFQQLSFQLPFQQLHVWPRDTRVPGDRGFLPGPTAESTQWGARLLDEAKSRGLVGEQAELNQRAKMGQSVLDCVLVGPSELWIGFHSAERFGQQWPGGVLPTDAGKDMVSRAYLKMDEALRWSELPIRPGDHCVEIGSAPGGSCQSLLDRGLHVTGIDPAEMDPRLLEHPHFTHIRKRGEDLRRREYAEFKWLTMDANVVPSRSLDTVESIVTHAATHVRGMLLTLKLRNWRLVDQLPNYVERIQSWGFQSVRVRQLAYQRQEVCVAAMRTRGMRRPRRPSSENMGKR